MRIAHTVNAIIIEKNKILLIKRAEKEDEFFGYWSIPGGGIEIKETIDHALNREIKEELNCKIINKKYFKSYYFIASRVLHVHASYFECKIRGKIKINDESSEYKWFDFKELSKIKIAFNQKKIIKEFLKK